MIVKARPFFKVLKQEFIFEEMYECILSSLPNHSYYTSHTHKNFATSVITEVDHFVLII